MESNKPLNEKQRRILCRCNIVFGDLQKNFNYLCCRVIQQHDVKDVNGNYLDAYPIVAAVLLDECVSILNGSSQDRVKRNIKQLAHKYMNKKLDV